MFRCLSYIVIFKASGKKLELDFLTSIDIDSSWEKFTDTATVQLPRKLVLKSGEKLQDVITPGDRITVKIGYDADLRYEFEGFVSRLDANVPINIFCEDNMYLLKKGTISNGYKKGTLKEAIDDLLLYYNSIYSYGFDAEVLDADLGAFRYKDLTGAQVLTKIKEDYGLISYFRGNTLHCGFAYTTNKTPNTVKYGFYNNIIDSGLEYRRAEDVKIKVKAISNKADNSKITVELGDPDGDVRTLNFFNLDKPGLEAAAKAEMKRLKFDGYSGSIKTFGRPFVKHGDVAEIIDQDYPERAGKYQVDAVRTTFGIRGFKRTIKLGARIS